MPTFDFKCLKCGHEFEYMLPSPSIKQPLCLKCGHHNTKKLISAPAVHFKGKGFHNTDYKKPAPPKKPKALSGKCKKCPVAEKCREKK